jgi:hypothetical protein
VSSPASNRAPLPPFTARRAPAGRRRRNKAGRFSTRRQASEGRGRGLDLINELPRHHTCRLLNRVYLPGAHSDACPEWWVPGVVRTALPLGLSVRRAVRRPKLSGATRAKDPSPTLRKPSDVETIRSGGGTCLLADRVPAPECCGRRTVGVNYFGGRLKAHRLQRCTAGSAMYGTNARIACDAPPEHPDPATFAVQEGRP